MTTETILRALVAAGNKHLTTPNVKAFALALVEAETYLAGLTTQAPPAARVSAAATYTAPEGNPWPPHWPSPDAILAACADGAREGQVRTALSIGQFSARHALHRLAAEGWISKTEAGQWLTRQAAPAPETEPYAETTLETVRALLPTTSAEDAIDAEEWERCGKLEGMDPDALRVLALDPALLAGVKIVADTPPRYWLPKAEPEPDDDAPPTD